MAVLSAGDRVLGCAEFIRRCNAAGEGIELTKAQVKAAYDALDDYFNTNAAAINSAIPLPARTTMTTSQKARLGQMVLFDRYIAGA